MNIYVIEDEYWALAELQTLLTQYESDNELFYFDNGDDAYEEMLRNIPDLVITDITMPGISGVELVKKIKQVTPTTECIFLTVHDTFDYAKKGIELNIVDYLLKPINKMDLYKTVDQTISKINMRKKEQKHREIWLLTDLVKNINNNHLIEIEKFNEQPLDLVYLLFGNWKADCDDREKESIFNQPLEQFLQVDDIWKVELDCNRMVILIPVEDQHTFHINKYIQLHQMMNENIQVHCGYMRKRSNELLYDSFTKLHQLMENHTLFGYPTFITENMSNQDVDYQMIWDYIRYIEKCIHKGEISTIALTISKLVNELKYIKFTLNKLIRFIWDVYYALTYKLGNGMMDAEKESENIEKIFEQLKSFTSYQQFENWLNHFILQLAQLYQPNQIAPKNLVPLVKEWIQESYAESIIFQQFADEYHVSLGYLSREFKEQTGMNFTEYLSNYRVEKAKLLFRKGVTKTSEVAELVGYQDTKYFREVFKKHTGLTPTQYIRQVIS